MYHMCMVVHTHVAGAPYSWLRLLILVMLCMQRVVTMVAVMALIVHSSAGPHIHPPGVSMAMMMQVGMAIMRVVRMTAVVRVTICALSVLVCRIPG